MNKVIAALLTLASIALTAYCDGSPDISKFFTKLDDVMMETVWCGYENEAVLVRTASNKVYRSDNRGESFKLISKSMLKAAEKVVDDSEEIGDVTRIVKSEADGMTLLFIGDKGVLWSSVNCGATMKALNKDFSIAQVRMHPTEPMWILATAIQDCKDDDDGVCFTGTHTLYMTQDLGVSWREIATNVKLFDWSFNAEQVFSGIPSERIYATVRTPKQDILVRTDDFFGNITNLVSNCFDFKIRANFMFAIKQEQGEEVSLLVSNFQDKFTRFFRSVFPDIRLKVRNVHILDSSENVVFVLTTRRPDYPYGRLYISDSTGLRYRLALKNCLRHPSRGADLAKIEGLEGIYMANIYENRVVNEYERMADKGDEEAEWGDEEKQEGMYSWMPRGERKKGTAALLAKGVKTVITFNKGGDWHYLVAPRVDANKKAIRCKSEDGCSLNLFLYSDTVVPVYSQNYAHGLILATGNVGKTRLPDIYARNVYLSRDGGLTWLEIAQGTYVYDMADHGGLIAMSKLRSSPKHQATILYSWNEGSSWENLTITTENATVEDIFTEPDSISQHFLVHITEYAEDDGKVSEKRSSLYSLNFEQLHQRACIGEERPDRSSSDFEYWSPYDGRHGQSCLLGRRISYVRRKQDSECYNGVRFESPVSIENCECSEEDYECEFGFTRKDFESNSPCVAAVNISYAPPADCPTGSTYNVTNGYRKIVGDSCQGGVSHDPIVIPCPASSLVSGSGITILILLCVIVVMLMGIGYIYQNLDTIRKRLQDTFSSKTTAGPANKKEYRFNDIKYGKIEEKQEETEEEVILQPTAVPEGAKKDGAPIEMKQ